MNIGASPLSGRNLLQALLLINGPLLDNARSGPYVFCVGRTINTGATALPHILGRVPNGYVVYKNSSGGVVYDTSSDDTAWTAQSITLRATVAGTYAFFLF